MGQHAPTWEGNQGRSTPSSARRPRPEPRDLTSFVGRSAELETLAGLVTGPARLVSVIGPPGIGKTRTVRRLLETLDSRPGGASSLFCDLRGVDSPEGLCAALAEVLDGHLETGEQLATLIEAVGQLLASRGPALIVLDNFEQLVPSAAVVLQDWLRASPETTFVVTSRRLLRLRAERSYELEPLPLPSSGTDPSEAVTLFVDRALATEPAFDNTAESEIHALVRRLEGLPLALELAAGQMRSLKPGELLNQLGKRSALTLVADARDFEPRHASLRAAIESSWQLLEPHEQSTLTQLTVCRQGFTLEATEAIVDLSAFPNAPPVRSVVTALREATLLRIDDHKPSTTARRWDMYEAIREYAAEFSTDEAETRHVGYYLAFGEARVQELASPEAARARIELNCELGNLQAASDHAHRVETEGREAVAELALVQCEIHRVSRPALAITPLTRALGSAANGAAASRGRLLTARGACYRSIGEVARARADLDAATSLADSDPLLRAEIDVERAALFFWTGDIREARDLLRQTIAIAEQYEARPLEMTARCWLGRVLNQGFQDPNALTELDRALALAQASGDVRRQAQIRTWRAVYRVFQERWGDPTEEIRAQIATAQRLQDREIESLAEQILGIFYLDRGHPQESRRHLLRSLELSHLAGLRRYQAAIEIWLSALEEGEATCQDLGARHNRTTGVFTTVGDHREQAYALLMMVAQTSKQGSVGRALELLNQGESLGHRFGEEAIQLLAEIQRARVELVQSQIAAKEGDHVEAARLVQKAEHRVKTSTHQSLSEASDHAQQPLIVNRSPEARWALRCFEAELAPLDARRRVIWVWADGRHFQIENGPTVDLPSGSIIRRAFVTFVDNHLEAPGKPTAMEDLMTQCWPGERMSPRTRSQRVRQIVTRLRKAGLQGLLHHDRAGYFLDRQVAIRRAQPAD